MYHVQGYWDFYCKFAIPSCSRYLARVIYKLCLNSWNTNYSQNVTCVCKKNIISVKHILLECPITAELFQKNGYDLIAYNNVRDILYNNDVITNIVKSIVHSPVGKLVYIIIICFRFLFLSNITSMWTDIK